MDGVTRRGFLVAAGAGTLAGCIDSLPVGSDRDGASGSGDAGASGGDGTTESGVAGSSVPLAEREKPLPMSPATLREKSESGGPGKDGIPAIDDPTVVDAGSADRFLDGGDVVFGVVRNGTTRAYPQTIMVWHEVCNDTLGGLPVSITYCPLTGTAMGFERGGTTFGVSGRLVNNNLIMYDRETETWWPQVLATSIPGPWNADPGTASLREFRLVWTTWRRWKRWHPDTEVLSTDTGHARNYGRDPYGSYDPRGGYYEQESTLFPPFEDDDRYHPKTVVIGARTAEGAVAVPKDALREQKLVAGDLGGEPVLAVYDPRFHTGYVYRNHGSAPFSYDDGSLVDEEGGSHEPDSLPLPRLHAFDAMWFAWVGFYPETTVHERS